MMRYLKYCVMFCFTLFLSVSLFSSQLPQTKEKIKPIKIKHCRMNDASLLDQCSRYNPPFESTFLPKRKEVKSCFYKMSKERSYIESRLRYPIEDYQAQITGFINDGKSYLYFNCMKKGFMSFRFFMKKPLVVCDGGQNFWGLVYCIDTHTIEGISFNGFL
ncbi:MAG: hypothetical protein C0596_00865 [Marinilabiliales bacterium]|nr:MAG: hypothetical protein C0596_00865 [Marinilabiliales bacterium]